MGMTSATDTAARFEGHWIVDRHIHDFDSAWQGRFRGRAEFVPVPGAFNYLEEGELQLGGLTLNASRRYRYLFPARDRVEVLFEDSSPFHTFDPTLPRSEASHVCGGDTYEVTYMFPSPTNWRADWRVEGPRKNYRLVTYYRRPEPAAQ